MAHTQSPHSLTVTHFLLVFGASHYRKKGKRQIAAKKFASLLQVARLQLHLSALPKCSSLGQSPSLPCIVDSVIHSCLLIFLLWFSFFLSFFFCWAVFVLKRVGRFLFVCLFVRLDSECITTKPASGLMLTVVLKAWMVSREFFHLVGLINCLLCTCLKLFVFCVIFCI